MLISVKLLTKYVIIIYALGSAHEKFGVWIKAVPKSLQRQNSRPGKAKRTAEPFQIETGFLIDSDAELFMYLIQCIRFGSRKVRRLNRALIHICQKKSKNISFHRYSKFPFLYRREARDLDQAQTSAMNRQICLFWWMKINPPKR